MWSKLFGGDDGLPREKVDAVVHVIDRYLAEEAELRGLQSEKQTIHPRDLPPAKRRALIEECSRSLRTRGRSIRDHDHREYSGVTSTIPGLLATLHLLDKDG
jgi:hypothetical protein